MCRTFGSHGEFFNSVGRSPLHDFFRSKAERRNSLPAFCFPMYNSAQQKPEEATELTTEASDGGISTMDLEGS